MHYASPPGFPWSDAAARDPCRPSPGTRTLADRGAWVISVENAKGDDSTRNFGDVEALAI
jgi:hypothetical protein